MFYRVSNGGTPNYNLTLLGHSSGSTSTLGAWAYATYTVNNALNYKQLFVASNSRDANGNVGTHRLTASNSQYSSTLTIGTVDMLIAVPTSDTVVCQSSGYMSGHSYYTDVYVYSID